jgi:Baseplate hub gp41
MLFDRVIELTVGDTEITGLDIAFEIEKDESLEPNPCHIEIYNLGPENRATLSKYSIVPVVLKAGYKDNVGIIFKGDMVRCSHLMEKASWKTTLACGDGALAIQSKRTNKSYQKGTPVSSVVKDLAKQLDLPSGNALSQLQDMSANLTRSLSLSGSAMAEVNRILAGQGMRLSIQNSALQLRKNGQPLQKEAISLSSDSGLKASPEIGSDGKLTVRTLLIPELSPGSQVHIDSGMFKGFVTIERVRFIGSTFGDEWESELECVAV